MGKTALIFCCLVISYVLAKPANNDQLDKATVNDVSVNSITPSDKIGVDNTQKKDGASVQITGITTGAENSSNSTLFKPQKTGSMFARLIDDIFQIPITVLQNVAKLITNPFTQHNKTPTEATPVAA